MIVLWFALGEGELDRDGLEEGIFPDCPNAESLYSKLYSLQEKRLYCNINRKESNSTV